MLNALKFIPWLIGQIFLSGFSVITAAVKKDTGFNPVVIRYPLRVTTDFQIAALSTCITATPSTLSLGLREPRKPGDPTILLIQAVFGSDPVEVFESIADMEQRLAPAVAAIDHGVPGQGPHKDIRPGDSEWPSREIADTAQNTVSRDEREF
ncbi:monovalent cation/H+ antiporter subunit E [Corynebacterium crudilactis]|uniref:Cation:proton antiporter n=1 Tax=Corynebacterium crudilactis TaxID=1652495 RepID=A0A172QQP3_9CORY|nr:monovalent cation/H+ antiporter subunit E [Corynebacterium crudilactis]ANE02998.1 cation:proton antiporter [Corynebacterium crudilactis]